jgi:hypothetical protein
MALDILKLMQMLGQGGNNPLANALGKYSAGSIPGTMPGSGMPPMNPDGTMKVGPSGPAYEYSGFRHTTAPPLASGTSRGYEGPAGAAFGAYPQPYTTNPNDEDMLNQVSDEMGGDEGDMEAAKQALVEMYQSGDPSDPRTLEQWRQAKQDFISQYGEENLPDLPNDPEEEGETTPDDEQSEGGDQYADDARRRQSEDTYGRELKRLGKRSTVVS